jgi:RHS repeat-associated protein
MQLRQGRRCGGLARVGASDCASSDGLDERPARTLALRLAFVVVLAASVAASVLAAPAAADIPPDAIRYAYDSNGRLTSVTTPADRTPGGTGSALMGASYRWDKVGNPLSVDRFDDGHTTVLELTPTRGNVGDAVTLRGVGFSTETSANTVRFNGTSATVTSATATELRVQVPQEATSGPVSVDSPSGSASSPGEFIVGNPDAPTITTISPTVAAAGDQFTLTGTNFDPSPMNDVIATPGVRTFVQTASTTTAQAAVPNGTGSGPISISTPTGTATGPDLFVPPSGYSAASVDDTGRLQLGQTRSAVLHTAGKISIYLLEGHAGQRVSVSLSGPTLTRYSLAWHNPDGSQLAGSGTLDTSSALFDQVRFPSDGTYALILYPYGSYTGSVNVKVNDVPDLTGTLSPSAAGDSKDLSFGTPGQNARLTFSGSAGQQLALRFTNPSLSSGGSGYTTIYKPDGTILNTTSIYFGSSGGWAEPISLPTSGTYTVLVDPYTTTTGSIRLTAYDVVDVAGGSLQPTTAGATRSTTITTPGQRALYNVSLQAGQRVSLTTSGSTIPGYSIKWLNPAGSTVATSNNLATGSAMVNYGYSSTWTDQFVAPSTGVYTLVVDPSATNTGTVTFTAFDTPDVTGSMALSAAGDARDLTFAAPGQNARLTFSGTAGQRIALQASNMALSTGGSAAITVYKPDGSTLVNTTATSSGAFIDPVALPTTGTYTILVDPSGTTTGSLRLTGYDVTDITDSLNPTTAGASRTVTFSTPGQRAVFSVAMTTGERASVVTSGSTISSSTLTWQQPSGSTMSMSSFGTGTVLAVAAWPYTNGDQILASSTGTYTLTVDPSSAITGSVTVTVYDSSDLTGSMAPSAGGDPRDLAFAAPAQNARLTFGGTAGQRIAFAWSNLSLGGGSGQLRLFKPDGSQLSASTFSSGSTFVEPVTLPTAGNYTAFADPSGMTTGSARLTGYAVPDDLAGTLTPSVGGDGIDLAFGTPGQNARITFPGTAGQRVSLRFSNSTIAAGNWYVYNPDGSSLSGTQQFSTATLTAPLPLLPTTGTYAVVVNPSAANTGSLRLTAYDGIPAGFRVGRPAHPQPDATSPGRRGAPPSPWHVTGARAQGGRSRPRYRTLGAYLHGRSTQRGRGGPAKRHNGAAQKRRRGVAPTLHAYLHPKYRREAAGRRSSAARDNRRLRRDLIRQMKVRGPLPGPSWRPHQRDRGKRWAAHRGSSQFTRLGPYQAPPGITAVAGQALKLNGLPLAGVRVSLEGHAGSTLTDETGRFILPAPPGHRQVLMIDGQTAGKHGLRFGQFQAQVQTVPGRTTALPYTIWMTPLDSAADATVAAPTRSGTVLTNPRIPGFEVHIPAGSRITDADGKAVHRLNLTPIPVNRPPFPLPPLVHVPVYFTVQPGGAYLSKGARIIYPNWGNLPAGQRVDFWDYDADDRGWYVYGHGAVTRDRKQVVPDPGVRVWQLTGAMSATAQPGPFPYNLPVFGPTAGDPADLGTGLFAYDKEDLAVQDVVPAVVNRTYRQGDTNVYEFGVGTTSLFNLRIVGTSQSSDVDVILPDGARVHAVPTTPTNVYPAYYDVRTTPGPYFGASLVYDGHRWTLRLRDGSSYGFSSFGFLGSITDRAGNTMTITRSTDFATRALQMTTPNGRWIKFTYTGSYITAATDNGGRTVHYSYDTSGRLTSVTDPNGGTTTYAYNAAGQMTSITDPRNITYITNTYDSQGRIATQTMADGGTYRFDYTTDSSGRITRTQVTDPRGAVRKVEFNSNGYPISDTSDYGGPTEQRTTYEWLVGSNLLSSTTDPMGRTTSYSYDANGNVTDRTRQPGTESSSTDHWSYDPTFSQITSSTDALGHTTSYGYDGLGRLTSAQDPTNRQTTLTYTGTNPQPTSVTDAGGHTTTLSYTSGDPTSITDPLGRTTSGYYDAVGRPVRLTQPDGNTTRDQYDRDNQLVKTTAPDGGETTFTYDGNGNLTEVQDPRGNATTAAYDAMDRQARSADALGHDSTYDYDRNGNLTRATDRNGDVTTYRYDALDRPTFAGYGTAGSPGSETYDSTISVTYDNDDEPTQINDSAGGTITNGYDILGRLTSQTTPQGAIGYGYDAADRRISMSTGGLADTTYNYDDADRLTGISRGDQTVSFSYDPTGRPLSTTLPDGITENYTHDAASKLTKIDYQRDGSSIGTLEYAYNAIGQRAAIWGTSARTGLPDALTSATYDAENRLTNRGGAALSYDAEGNITNDGAATYTWNKRGELGSISASGLSASFAYDPLGRRTQRTVNDQPTTYRYDGPNPIREQTGDATTTLLEGLNLDDNYARTDSTGTSSFLTDELGSTVALADGSGTLRSTYTYDPFGATAAAGDPSDNKQQFTGRENDGTGLDYLRARYYSPTLARFISQDPLGLDGGDTNLFAYVGGDPVNSTDPSGLRELALHAWPNPSPFEWRRPDTTSCRKCGGPRMPLTGPLPGGGGTDPLGSIPGAGPVAVQSGAGATPAGRPISDHARRRLAQRGIPETDVDQVVNRGQGTPVPGGKQVHHDKDRDLTVVTGDDDTIVTAHRGRPEKGPHSNEDPAPGE